MRVLVVKLSSMGDIIHAFPAVSEAAASRPDMEIDWCVDGAFAELVRLHPLVRTIYANEAVGHRWAPPSRDTLPNFRRLRSELRNGRYELVIDAQGLIRSAAIARLAHAPVAGYDGRSIRETLAALAYSRRLSVSRELHAVARMRMLFAAALGYAVDPQRVPTPLAPAARQDDTVFLLHGTTAASKRWPTGHWVELARAVSALGLAPVVTWISEAERTVAEAIAAGAPATRIIARTSLTNIAGEIGRAALVIGVDTGLAHLADMLGVPTVMLFQASNPALTGPCGERSLSLQPTGGVPRRPLRRHAQLPADPARIVPVGEVVEAMSRQLRRAV